MPGIMFGAALKGFGDSLSSLGDSAQADLRDERQAQQREQLARLREQAPSRDSAPRGRIDFSPGSAGEEAMAADMGMTVPDLRKFREANRSGDFSGYVGAPAADETDRWDVAVAKGQQKWIDDKRRMLGEISRMYLQGDAYGDSAQGRLLVKQMGFIDEERANATSKPDAVAVEEDRAGAGQAPVQKQPAQRQAGLSVGKRGGTSPSTTAAPPAARKTYYYDPATGGLKQ